MITKYTIVVPGRIASTRMQNKLARNDTGKALMQETIDQCRKSCAERVLFTVDSQALASCLEYGPDDMAFITTRECRCGTERVAMYVGAAPDQFAAITVNVQADEPMINPHDIDHLANELHAHPEFSIATLVAPLREDGWNNPDVVKAAIEPYWTPGTIATPGFIPPTQCTNFQRKVNLHPATGMNAPDYRHHVGVYAFRTSLLQEWQDFKFAYPDSTRAEKEGLEQLAWLDAGLSILAVDLDHPAPPSVNTPDDYAKFVEIMKEASDA
jgi:3-deoxy-manno-octulosonate cytidylyltransferase (CMP-KDO synthetase)